MDTPTSPTITTSKKYTLNWMDAGKGLAVAVGAAVVPIIYSTIEAGTLTFNLKVIGITALGAAFGYLRKNFFAESQTVITPAPTNLTVASEPGKK